MRKVKRFFKRFRVDDPDDLKEYNQILNDTMCTITERETQVETIKSFDNEGKLASMHDITTYLIHWEQLC